MTKTSSPINEPKSDLGSSEFPPRQVRQENALADSAADSTTVPSTSSFAHEDSYENPPIDRSFWPELLKYVFSATILAVGFGIAFGLSLLKEDPKGQNSKELDQMVSIVDAEKYSGELEMMVSGTVVPYREIRIAAEISGNVLKKYEAFEAGNFVKKGEKLLEIDPTDYQLQLETRKAEVEQSRKMIDETQEEVAGALRNIQLAKNEYRLAKSEFDRNARIKSALSSSELDQSKRGLLTAESALTGRKNTLEMLKARMKRMEAALALSNANLNRAKLNTEKTTIVAPDDGVIVREMVQEGDFVRAGDQLVTFEDISRSEVICNLTPTDLAWVRDNAPASAEFDNSLETQSVYYLPKTRVSVFEPGETEIAWDGILERFDGIGRDETTRSIPCRVSIQNPVIKTPKGQRALVRGMYVKCKIQVQTSAESDKESFISIPSVALRPGDVVWLVRDKKLKRVKAEVVHYTQQLVGEKEKKIVVIRESEDAVKSGDQIVTSPLVSPFDGMEVILEEEFRAAKKLEKAESNPEVASE